MLLINKPPPPKHINYIYRGELFKKVFYKKLFIVSVVYFWHVDQIIKIFPVAVRKHNDIVLFSSSKLVSVLLLEATLKSKRIQFEKKNTKKYKNILKCTV